MYLETAELGEHPMDNDGIVPAILTLQEEDVGNYTVPGDK